MTRANGAIFERSVRKMLEYIKTPDRLKSGVITQ
ncbi:hypothetical protein SPACI_009960 [Sporomusa acidovorans DSM 3132]|uniref:Uncharacterized protein n=1 Tax=Sporomusa acidovorans (strain ATCC 49682 / DSM 3132 / Mol) TaxID=1123286 RepID=A0ABZ3IYW9_SPOA4|nr:hypothetical protein SPACI_36810 [Sporomusa acidovorans DSM 3132]SDE11766.1 hypothetical protein SAMN04488499_100857 [Sporomusa acidovorans]